MNRKLFIIIAGLTFILAVLTGCRGAKNKTSGAKSTSIPAPAAEKASITGIVFSTPTNKPYPKAAVWLAEVYRQGDNGAYLLNVASSPAVYANQQGVFVFNNVDPKEYVIVVGDPENSYVVIPDDTGRARVWKTEGGKILDVGQLNVALDPAVP